MTGRVGNSFRSFFGGDVFTSRLLRRQMSPMPSFAWPQRAPVAIPSGLPSSEAFDWRAHLGMLYLVVSAVSVFTLLAVTHVQVSAFFRLMPVMVWILGFGALCQLAIAILLLWSPSAHQEFTALLQTGLFLFAVFPMSLGPVWGLRLIFDHAFRGDLVFTTVMVVLINRLIWWHFGWLGRFFEFGDAKEGSAPEQKDEPARFWERSSAGTPSS